MNSLLSFRVWHKAKSRYVTCSANEECEDLVIGLDGGLHFCDDGNGPRSLERGSDYLVERPTGLSDKSGIQIWEGDILRIGDWTHTALVRWHHGGFSLMYPYLDKLTKEVKWGSSSPHLFAGEWLKKLEVIGNVHENLELLTNGELIK